MATSEYLANEVLDHVLGGADYARPATVWIGLLRTDNSAELSGNGYSRFEMTNNATNFPAASSRVKANGIAIEFGPATDGAWSEVNAFRIFDAASGGNILFSGSLGVAKTVGVGDSASFGIGDLTINMDVV